MMQRGWRWMIAPVVCLMLSGFQPLFAQDPDAMLKEAIDLYQRGRSDEALEKLKAIIATDPSSEVAYRLYSSVDFDIWARAMVKGNEHAAVIQHLRGLSIPAEKAKAKDEGAIKALLEKVDGADFAERTRAFYQLAADHGEYVVPHLLPRLTSSSMETRAATMELLRRLERQAVMPLIQALEVEDPGIKTGALTVLGQIRDRRALPYLALYAEGPVQVDAPIREAARRALADMGQRPMGNVTALFLELAEAYYQRNTAVVDPFRNTYIVWANMGGNLVANEVPRELFHLKLAEETLFDLLAVAPDNMDARVLLASVLLAQLDLTRPAVGAAEGGEAGGPAMPLTHTTEMVLGLGVEVLDGALRKALADSRPEVASGAIRAIGRLIDADSFGSAPTLTQAVSAPMKEVRFEAALAIANAMPRNSFGGADQVVSALTEALGQDAIRTAVVIDDVADTRNQVVGDLNSRGWFAYGVASGPAGLAAVRSFPVEDLVVIRYDLRDATVAEVVRTLRMDERTKNTAVVVLGDQNKITAAKEAFADKVQDYVPTPPVADAYEPKLREIVKINDPARAGATMIAARAAETLAHLDPKGPVFPTSAAVDGLIGTLKGDDRVRIPAMWALGRIGDMRAMQPLMAVFGDASASEKVRGTAAVALARIARSMGSASPEVVAALRTAITGEGGAEYTELLGRACGIIPVDAKTRIELLAALRPRIKVDTVE